MAACPYDAIFINPEDHSAEKCNFCAHRLDIGLEPACVVVCPVEAILVGDLNDPTSTVAQIVARERRRRCAGRRRRPGPSSSTRARTRPRSTRSPPAGPTGGIFMWSEQPGGRGTQRRRRRTRGGHNSSAAALLAYDVPHRAPWDWRVSLYTWTKGIAAGAYLVAVAARAGRAARRGRTRSGAWAAPLVAVVFLGVTGGAADLGSRAPARASTSSSPRPQWRVWLVRGGVHHRRLRRRARPPPARRRSLGVDRPCAGLAASPGSPLGACMAAVYTAYLFAQAKARDLWQSPLLPAAPGRAGRPGRRGRAAAVRRLARRRRRPARSRLDRSPAPRSPTSCWCAGEVHPPAPHRPRPPGRPGDDPRAATPRSSGPGVVAGRGRPRSRRWIGAGRRRRSRSLGLLAHEHAYVQAGQSVPLA